MILKVVCANTHHNNKTNPAYINTIFIQKVNTHAKPNSIAYAQESLGMVQAYHLLELEAARSVSDQS